MGNLVLYNNGSSFRPVSISHLRNYFVQAKNMQYAIMPFSTINNNCHTINVKALHNPAVKKEHYNEDLWISYGYWGPFAEVAGLFFSRCEVYITPNILLQSITNNQHSGTLYMSCTLPVLLPLETKDYVANSYINKK